MCFNPNPLGARVLVRDINKSLLMLELEKKINQKTVKCETKLANKKKKKKNRKVFSCLIVILYVIKISADSATQNDKSICSH